MVGSPYNMPDPGQSLMPGNKRHRVSALVGFEDVHVCRVAYNLGLYQLDSVLLAES